MNFDTFLQKKMRSELPTKLNRWKREWVNEHAECPSSSDVIKEDKLINWTKPLEFIGNAPYGRTRVEYLHDVYVEKITRYLCKHWTGEAWYYAIYDCYGKFCGGYSSNLNIRNARVPVDIGGYMVLSKAGTVISQRYKTYDDAVSFTTRSGKSLNDVQIVGYSWQELQ